MNIVTSNINNNVKFKNDYFKDSNFGPSYDAVYDEATNLEPILICKRYKKADNIPVDNSKINSYNNDMNDTNNKNGILKCHDEFNTAS